MESLFNAVISALLALPPWEVLAASLGVFYIVFAARESQWCWPMAFISTLIYTFLFWEGQLPMQAFLHFYYMGMAIYGFILWRRHKQAESDLPIHLWGWSYNLLFIAVGTLLTWLLGHYLQTNQASQAPFLDAGVTVFSVMNTWLMARKVLQNWLYWVIIDFSALWLYLQTGFIATAALFGLYTILATLGLINWLKLYRQQTTLATS
ncbi:putative thiamin transporter PnuT [Methylophaga frappieri]|uniref:Nicotinamide riboside transporter PnuC n=1 Tax=Methylophaga frappieri (strain ATCC BAA-2434 / DSM 25690 / JAM7) TaxID=754477 RepID=I1YGU9_METFJ|nr:nicotinamide riboside transporter PnuC [Methylophaga frappieri]AFJ02142.1 putative thiamin transporter PnuT [Methylophaga frappieri]